MNSFRTKPEGKEENDEKDILEHKVGEELKFTEKGQEDDSNASDVDEYGNLKDFVVVDEGKPKLTSSHSIPYGTDQSLSLYHRQTIT